MSEQAATASMEEMIQENEALSVSINNDLLPLGWIKVKLADWLEKNKILMKNGFAYGGFNQNGQGTPHLRPYNVTSDGFIDLSQVKYVENITDNNPYLLQPNDIIFNNTNSEDLVGKTSYFSVHGKFVLSNHMTSIRILDNDHIDAFWLAMKLQHFWRLGVFKAICRRHVGQASISIERLGQLSISCPPPCEQRAIAHVLQTVQQAIKARRKELELERERKAALMQHLFTHGTRNEPTKQSEVGEIPESWRVAFLANLCSNEQGFVQTGPFGSQLHAYNYRTEGTPIINPTHLGVNIIVEENIPLIGQKDVERLAKHCLLEGDILISRRGDFSRYSYISSKHIGWVCGTGCLLIRLNNPNVDNYFLSICIGSTGVQRYLSDNAVGSIMPNINTKILERMPIALPPSIKEQQHIAHISRDCDAKIAALEKEIALHEELFRALLDELMTGRISTGPLIDELEKGTLTDG